MKRSLLSQFLKCSYVVCFMFCAHVISAQELLMSPVTVTAGRIEQDLQEVNMSVGVVNSKDIQQNPHLTVAEQLEDIPGVTVQDGSMAGAPRISIRGEDASRVLLLVDGVKNSEQKSMHGSSILSDMSQVERIEVIKGPASVLYGSEAIGGVVNIITKKGGDKPFGFSIGGKYDSSVKGFEPSAAIFGSYEGIFYRFSASGINAMNREIPGGKLNNSSFQRRSYSGIVGYEWADGQFWFKADKYESKIKVPGSDVRQMDLPKWNRDTLSMHAELRNISDNLVKLSFTPYYQELKKDLDVKMNIKMRPPMSRVSFSETVNDQKSYGGTVQSEWLFFDTHYLTAGIDYNKDDLKSTYYSESTMMPANQKTVTDHNYKAAHDSLGLYIQDGWNITENFRLDLGVRQTWFTSELKSSNDPITKTGKKHRSNAVISAGVLYSDGGLALRANFSQGYKFPNLNQLYIGSSHSHTMTFPNKDLKAESSNNYEVGVRLDGSNYHIDAAAYYSDAKNYITTQEFGKHKKFVNMDKARTYGLELYADYTFDDTLTPYVNVNLINRKIWDKGFTTMSAGVSPFTGKAGIKAETKPFDGLTVYCDLDMTWAAKTKKKDAENTTEYKSWETANFTAGLRGGSDHRYNLSLGVRNIFDRKYNKAGNSLQEAGTHYVVSLGYEF